MKPKRRVFRMWGIVDANGHLGVDVFNEPYLWSNRQEAEANADVLPIGADAVQRFKVTIEADGPLHRNGWWTK